MVVVLARLDLAWDDVDISSSVPSRRGLTALDTNRLREIVVRDFVLLAQSTPALAIPAICQEPNPSTLR